MFSKVCHRLDTNLPRCLSSTEEGIIAGHGVLMCATQFAIQPLEGVAMKVPTTNSLQERLGIPFRDDRLLEAALIHRSALNERKDGVESNDRLEFLGDAVLGMVVAEELYRANSSLSEGSLTQLRARIIRWDTLAEAARRISLGEFLILGRGEEKSAGRMRASNLAGALEAVIGAYFLDGGIDSARQLIVKLLKEDLVAAANGAGSIDSKSRLQHVSQTRWGRTPEYRLVTSEGPDHNKTFTIDVVVSDRQLGRGQGSNKKQAELEAARQALESLSSLS